MNRFEWKTKLWVVLGAWLVCCAGSAPAAAIVGQLLSLDSPDQWVLAADPANAGKQQAWWSGARPEAQPARTPRSIQETLGEYHGVAWYWRTVKVPHHPHPDGRYLLRFWSVDYFIEVWVNGRPVGSHECVDTMVEFDVTEAIRPDANNLVAVRLTNPGNKFFSGQTPPAEIVAGMINTSIGYSSGLTVSVHRVGKGRIVLNSLLIRENLSAEASHPVAERLLRNMLRFAKAESP